MTVTVTVTAVIPVYNEVDCVDALARELLAVPELTDILFVNDGSNDGTKNRLDQLAAEHPRIRAHHQPRNLGQSAAMWTGFQLATGELICCLDGDGQNDPADIPLLMAKINEGYDIVSGWRKDRQDRLLDRRLPSILANRLISNVTDVQLHDYGCSLKAYRSDVLHEVNLYGELHRFIPALASQIGAKITEVPVNHRARQFGTSKYGIGRTIRVVLDLITVWFLGAYATRPLQVFGGAGLLFSGLGFALGIYLSIVKLIGGEDIGGRPLLILVALLIMVGVQLITMGLIAEMITRTYHESQSKPIYVVREVLRSEDKGSG